MRHAVRPSSSFGRAPLEFWGALGVILVACCAVAFRHADPVSVARAAVGAASRAAGATPAAPSPREEFEAIARGLRAGSNMYLGEAPMADLRARLAYPALSPNQRYTTLMNLVWLEVRDGLLSEAITDLEEAGRILEPIRPQLGADLNPVLASYHTARAVAYMRSAEYENCAARHTAGSCILPLRGDAVHSVREPGQNALDSWMEVFARRHDLLSLWLVNIVAMQLGLYPDGLPPQLRLDFGRYQEQAGLGEFVDIAPRLGLDVFELAGGVVVEDMDGDGLLDIVTSTSDPEGHTRFHRNTGDGTFEDLTEASGLDQQFGGLNLVSTDIDNDGDADLYILRGGWLAQDGCIRNSLLLNDGHGRFEDATRALGLAEPALPTQAGAWADFDNDGDLDLYVGNEVRLMPDGRPIPYPCQLFRNEGGRSFVDIAAEAGVTNDRHAKGVAAGDYDNDGDMDLYVSNIGANRLYRNDGSMHFVDVAAAAGVIEPSGRSFVPWFFDYDEDGWLDLWVPAYDATPADLAADLQGQPFACQPPRLYHNNHDGTFTDVAAQANLAHPYRPMGANFGDIDNDGWLDIYLGTGDPEFTSLMPNVMLWNDHGLRFLDVTQETRLGHLQKGHGIAFADFDGDGDQDIFHQLGGFVRGDRFHSALFLNPGHGGHFLDVSLVGMTSNRPGVGVRLEVDIDAPGGRRVVHRAAGSVSSFGGSSLFRQEIGLGDATRIRELRAWWPASGERQVFTDVPLDAHIEITEGQSRLRLLEIRRVPLEAR